jgi:hypothetical protein
MFNKKLVLVLSVQSVETYAMFHAPFVKPRLRHIFFLDSPFPDFYGSDNGLREWLGVFLLHHRFYIWAIDISC